MNYNNYNNKNTNNNNNNNNNNFNYNYNKNIFENSKSSSTLDLNNPTIRPIPTDDSDNEEIDEIEKLKSQKRGYDIYNGHDSDDDDDYGIMSKLKRPNKKGRVHYTATYDVVLEVCLSDEKLEIEDIKLNPPNYNDDEDDEIILQNFYRNEVHRLNIHQLSDGNPEYLSKNK
ncbi:hypothetical protein ACTA71_009411 [Dictyostelium dimigraforme]